MVKVRADHPIAADGSVDIPAWIQGLMDIDSQPESTRLVLQKACELSSAASSVKSTEAHSWGADADCFHIGLEMAEILAELQLDQDALVAAILYRAVRENKLALAEVQAQFGDTVSKLIKGVLR